MSYGPPLVNLMKLADVLLPDALLNSFEHPASLPSVSRGVPIPLLYNNGLLNKGFVFLFIVYKAKISHDKILNYTVKRIVFNHVLKFDYERLTNHPKSRNKSEKLRPFFGK